MSKFQMHKDASAITAADAVFDLKQVQLFASASLLFLGSSQKRNIK